MKLRLLVVSIGAGLGANVVLSSFAQENIQLAQVYSPGLADEVVVTASRSPQSLQDTLASTTLITREQIETSQARDVYQLLKTVPGVSVRRSGGRGSATSLFMRGGDASSTLILVDGVNIESATLGQVALEQLSIDQIERIEITRGPKSSLYGSSAMSGVVQIFTRKAAPQDGVTYSAGMGNDKTRDGSISASGSSATNRYNLTATHSTGDGFDSQFADDEVSGIAYYDYDDDAWRRSALSLNVEQDLGEYFTGNVVLNRGEGESEYDVVDLWSAAPGQTLPYSTFDTLMSALSLTFEGEDFRSKLQYGHLEDSSEQHNDVDSLEPFEYSLIETNRDTGLWENTFTATDWATLNLGVDYTHEEVAGTVIYSEDRRDTFGGYANSRLDVSSLSWLLGMRHDDHEAFGSKWTGDTALGWEFVDGVTASASYGTGFKAPSFNDLYWPASPYSAGNPDLLPEETDSYELGVDAYRDWGNASVHVYKSHVENLIQWAEVSPYFWTPSNVGQVKTRGAELQLGTEQFGMQWLASFTYEKVTDAATGTDLDRRPRRRAALDMDKQLGDIALGATLSAQSSQYDGVDDNGERETASGFGQADLRVAWQATKELKVRARLDNMFDTEFEEIVGFNNEGRFLMVFVDYTAE
ncbi:MAG: TonB-dependent receptor [Gammaproteobacteria bacterium]|nr:TonB-dependent receptor [Gammaproteobacteria bacterium]